MIYIVLMKKGIGMEFMYNFILLGFGLIVAMLLFAFYIADIWGRLFIAVVLLFTFISMSIIKTDTMHNFISYLTNIGFIDSIYWTLYGLSLPIILLLAKPLAAAVNNKSLVVKCITGFSFIIFMWALILPVVAAFAYRMYHF